MENGLNIPVPLQKRLSDGVTQEDRLIWRMDVKLNTKIDSIGKYVESLIWSMMGILIPSEAEYLTESTLTRKTSSEFLSDRTVNWHR